MKLLNGLIDICLNTIAAAFVLFAIPAGIAAAMLFLLGRVTYNFTQDAKNP
jgi:hypothetical protein